MIRPLRVALVGPSAAGKSTLAAALVQAGFMVRHVAQEHSYAPAMWQQVSRPDVLLYLDAELSALQARRPSVSFGPAELAEERRRLAHARAHCDLYLDTTGLAAEEVQRRALAFLAELKR
ncbi:MAG: hypothetical protein ACRDHL_13870 [Candidatus Promineifilaceae bacterium]